MEFEDTIGVNLDLAEREYNFHSFKLMCPESETEECDHAGLVRGEARGAADELE